jgi:iron(III) transport system substrate-binding protein
MRLLFAASAALVALFLAWWVIAHRGPEPLVVYCAHDSIYAEKILRDFEKQSGIPVATRYDTEATKSLGLLELLVREKEAPRCDVFWNNELLGMSELAGRDILLPCKGQGWARMPERFRDPDGAWTGFAARLRVVIYNPQRLLAAQIPDRLAGDLSRVAMAKPLYGTTLTHYTVLWQTLGADGLKAWHKESRARGLLELNGNAAVKDAVAQGVCDLGFTDTDDFFEAKDAGKSVAAEPVRLGEMRTIVIPNTVAIIRGTHRESKARKLVDFLLSEETELALARSKSRQIPLGPVPTDQLPPDVRELAEWAKDGFDLRPLRSARTACLEWLKSEYFK